MRLGVQVSRFRSLFVKVYCLLTQGHNYNIPVSYGDDTVLCCCYHRRMGLVIVLAVWSAIKRTGSPILCPSLSSVVAVKLLPHEINLNSTLTSSGHSRFNWKYSEY